ncbi:MAG: hypothetical protein ACM3PE_07985 [Deltaproteobacteria bacterium]
MGLKKDKFVITICLAVCLCVTGSIGSISPELMAANVQNDKQTNKSTSSQTNKQSSKQNSQSNTAAGKTNNSTLNNTSNQPEMPIMPVMPAVPANSSNTTSTSVLNRPWDSQDRNSGIQLKTRWEDRRNILWDKNNKKVLINIQKKKENIHMKGKGKSSQTEVPIREK